PLRKGGKTPPPRLGPTEESVDLGGSIQLDQAQLCVSPERGCLRANSWRKDPPQSASPAVDRRSARDCAQGLKRGATADDRDAGWRRIDHDKLAGSMGGARGLDGR
ncbi:MAG: hypothetical protein ACHRXM_40170, partial [Isosphaerales bacterium]